MHAIGIRREDRDAWETRTPLLPDDAEWLATSTGTRVYVQPSHLRVFPDDDYLAHGSRLSETLNECDVVLAVKEIPAHLLSAGKTYLFFSHTIKGQAHSMPMLRRLMELRCQLIDYERIRDASGARLIYFSRFAGLAGTIDTLWALGRRLDAEGLTPNPFADLTQTYKYSSLDSALAAVERAGELLRRDGLPAAICPFVIGVAGYGNVSKGAQEVLGALGARTLTPDELRDAERVSIAAREAFMTVFTEREMVQRRPPSSDPFSLEEYFRQPERYAGNFERWLPSLSLLVNCIYWDARYPRLVTKKAVQRLFGDRAPRLQVIGDISCDIEGAIEITAKETSLDNPVYVYDTETEAIHDGVQGHGPVILAVANLPCELAREASQAFSTALRPFLPALVNTDFNVPFADLALPPELKGAVILHHGELTPEYAYLNKHVNG